MTTVFADASALVKRYQPEVGSSLVEDALAGVDLVVSTLSTVETQSAFWRLARMGVLSTAEARRLCRQFLYDIRPPQDTAGGTAQVPLTDVVLDHAGTLLSRHPLGAGDAIQLACVLTARDTVPDIAFLCFDRRLREAAEHEGLAVIPSA